MEGRENEKDTLIAATYLIKNAHYKTVACHSNKTVTEHCDTAVTGGLGVFGRSQNTFFPAL